MGRWQDWLGASPWIILGALMLYGVLHNLWHGHPWDGGVRPESKRERMARYRREREIDWMERALEGDTRTHQERRRDLENMGWFRPYDWWAPKPRKR